MSGLKSTLALSLFGLVLFGTGDTMAIREQTPDLQGIMRLKLGHTQKVLEGIVLEDFSAVEEHARELARLIESSEWIVLQTPDYVRFSNDLMRATEYLIESAAERNLDGAALDYVDLTLTCVQCHKHVRGVRRASAPELVGARAAPQRSVAMVGSAATP